MAGAVSAPARAEPPRNARARAGAMRRGHRRDRTFVMFFSFNYADVGALTQIDPGRSSHAWPVHGPINADTGRGAHPRCPSARARYASFRKALFTLAIDIARCRLR